MHKDLLLKAFEKTRENLILEGVKSPSLNKIAKELSAIISESFVYGDRSLRDFYKEAISKVDNDIEIPQPQVIVALAKYLGYMDYKDYLLKNELEEKALTTKHRGQTKTGNWVKKNSKWIKSFSIVFIVGIICFLGYNYFNKQRWMEWNETHFVEVAFDSEKIKDGVLKLYKEERIRGFKKLFPNCESTFFNGDGAVKIWYGKNKELEYFSSYGLHPETGKTLKPITKYMVKKHICKSFSSIKALVE